MNINNSKNTDKELNDEMSQKIDLLQNQINDAQKENAVLKEEVGKAEKENIQSKSELKELNEFLLEDTDQEAFLKSETMLKLKQAEEELDSEIVKSQQDLLNKVNAI